MNNYFRWAIFLSVEWWLLLLPKSFHILSFITEPIHRLIYPLVVKVTGDRPFFEDSTGMYVLFASSAILGLITALPVFLPRVRPHLNCDPMPAVRVLIRYFLILELWEYGWAKLTKMQFYLPEPNTVYTELGALSKDIAYWSVVGSSPAYVIFLGIVEILSGTMLLFRRTRFAGLLLSLGIFVNVVMVNMAFDISVKLFSFTLLGMAVFLLVNYRNHWLGMLGMPAHPRDTKPVVYPAWRQWVRAGVLSLMVVEVVYPSVMTGSFNDDTAERPPFHGAYAIHDHAALKNLFVHRRGYVIFEDNYNRQADFKILSEGKETLQLLNERTGETSSMSLKKSENGMIAVWQENKRLDTLKMSELPYNELPLFDSSVNWFSDRYH